MTDQVAGHEIAGHEKPKPNCSLIIQFTAVALASILLVKILSMILDACDIRLIVR